MPRKTNPSGGPVSQVKTDVPWTGCKVLRIRSLRHWCGARAGAIDVSYLADRVWPDADYGRAFAYLWRRFGPPQRVAWDRDKQLCEYDLTTPDPEIGFWLACNPSSCGLEPGHWIRSRIHTHILNREYKDQLDWPLADPNKGIYGGRIPPEGTVSRRAHDTIEAGMRDLLRPVSVRDVSINFLGRLTAAEAAQYSPAQHAWTI